jgi:hypothetical protein
MASKIGSNIVEVNKSIQMIRDLEAARYSAFIASKKKSHNVPLSFHSFYAMSKYL